MKAISTNVPGISICERLLRTANIIDRTTIVRSLTHPYPLHGVSYAVSGLPTFTAELEHPEAMLETSESPTASIETSSRYHGQLVAHICEHPVLGALKLTFSFHHPLVLSPDTFWLLICQGVAQHISLHSESLRSKFVQHAGKELIDVRRDDFIKGSLENLWSEVIDELRKEVGRHIGSIQELFIPNFSTTSATERTVVEITLLDAVESYFEYRSNSLCGIPEVALEGTVEDWQMLADRVEAFAEFDLEWWLNPLRPILRELVATARGDVRKAFWKSIYKFESESGAGLDMLEFASVCRIEARRAPGSRIPIADLL